jgi:signal transduction histidine kinase/ligand-binding sensor domain-containing protein
VTAGIAGSEAQRYPFFNIGIEQGLVQSQVFALVQDSAGHLWAGTYGGLSCYDGHSFRTFTMRDGLPSNTITSLCCNKTGDICIGTARGLSVYDGHVFRNYSFASPDNPKGNYVSRIALSSDGALWCIAGQMLYRVAAGKISHVPVPGRDKVMTLNITGDDIWTCPSLTTCIYRCHRGNWDSVALPCREALFAFRLYEDNARRLLLFTGGGVFRYEQDRWNLLLERKTSKEPLPYSFAEAKDGSYWIGTTSGAIRLSGEEKQFFSRKNGLSDLTVHDIICDHEGNIWLATNGEGIYRFSGAAFTAIDEHMGLSAPQVSGIAQAPDGTVYFGTYDGGLFHYANGSVKPVLFPGIPVRISVSCLELRGHTLWIGTQGLGLLRYDVASGAISQYKDARLGPTIIMMEQDTTGVWIGDGKNVFLAAHDSLHELHIKTSSETFVLIGRDSILLSTPDGFLLYNKDTTRVFSTHSAADSGQVVCMSARGGVLWIGTSDDGLFGYQLHTGSTIHITRKDGLRSDFIYNVYASPDGSIWAGTGFGICHIRPLQPHPLVTFYGRNAGLTGMESNRNALLALQDGSIWFGTTGGALLYHPQNALAVTKPVSLQLQNVALFGEPVRDTTWYKGTTPLYGIPTAMRLPWQKNNLSFSFSAISLTGDADVVYRYRLDGLAAPWSEWSTTNTVTFSALPPGRYELQVQCSTDGVNPQQQMLRYPFEIITPFHKTTLFRLLVIIACIILGVGLQYLAARRKRRRRAQLDAVRREEQGKVRQRTAEDFHDEVGNRLTRINVLTNVLRSKVGASPDASRLIDQIQDNAGQLYSGTRDILWSLQPSNDNLYEVMNRIRDFGRDLFGDTDTDFEMQDIPQAWREYPLAMDASRNLIMIFKEALNNVLKYAGATRVTISCHMHDGRLDIVLHDNGEGFDHDSAKRGQGITNMRTRAGRLGGTLEIDTGIKKGTNIILHLKIPQNTGLRISANGRNL